MNEQTRHSRRNFLSVVACSGAFLTTTRTVPGHAQGNSPLSIQAVIDILKSGAVTPVGSTTVDTVKSGDPSRPVTGVVTTFMANCGVIQRAIELNANLIVTHEPTFYNHEDQVDWLEQDSVYRFKRNLLEGHGIVVWRFHDFVHRFEPDPVRQQLAERLGWEQYAEAGGLSVFALPPRSLGQLAREVKTSLGVKVVRMIGEPAMPVSRVGVLPGAAGGKRQISFVRESRVQVLLVGEMNEWETAEYMRDAMLAGQERALLIAGHANTEEPGMKWLVGWLRERLPGIPVHHVPGLDPFEHI